MLVAVALITAGIISVTTKILDRRYGSSRATTYSVAGKQQWYFAQASRNNSIVTTPNLEQIRMSDELCVPFRNSARKSPLHSDYNWIGNNWVPPTGVPRYTPADIRNLLRKENVLFLGDSTARQDYFTLFNLMNATDDHDITHTQLNQGINVNKSHKTEYCTSREDPELTEILSVCRQVPMSKFDNRSSSATTSTQSTHPDKPTTQSTGAIDLLLNPRPCNCFKNIPAFVNASYTSLANSYSVMVFALGVWESVESESCQDSGKNGMLQTLAYLKKFSVDTRTLILWRTHGGGGREYKRQRNITREIHHEARQWFERHQPRRMALVEFGTQVAPRTYGDDRIEGDSNNHFGAEARTLSLQLITDALYQKRCER
jgi:hypothetical protein